ncbi:PadR family transcriptional regulator [Sinomonas sp. JGH33]|uniref:PadR family transcriptional regulator n=1 Tax=Sinomonas terricola TaxID=3110330 RepID=A0ABU5T0J2_9MICC|nr:PadR family transcriptional regulator [Sinomonas sp. JGH33]MEA5453172.1 PadR family transcriptional regulator [Sinomonas sp. JGH33]
MQSQLGGGDAANIRRSVLPLSVLLALESGPSYAYELARRLRGVHDLVSAENDLYGCLKRLRSRGFLAFEWKESAKGPPQKLYRLTEKGLDHLAVLIEVWGELRAALLQMRHVGTNDAARP